MGTLDLTKIHSYGSVNDRINTAALGVAAPTMPLPTALPSPAWQDLGWLDPQGITETPGQQETKKYGFQGGGLLRSLRSQFENPFTFLALEAKEVTEKLRNPFGTRTATAGTAEQQTITITGVPTGGTFTPSLNGVSGGAQAYNVTQGAMQTALQTAWAAVPYGATVTVVLAGSVYTLTFPVSNTDVPAMTITSALTGGTTPSAAVATSVPGVKQIVTWGRAPQGTVNYRQFAIDLSDGTINNRIWIPNGEAFQSGGTTYTHDDFTAYPFTIQPYLDGSGHFFYLITDDGNMIPGTYL